MCPNRGECQILVILTINKGIVKVPQQPFSGFYINPLLKVGACIVHQRFQCQCKGWLLIVRFFRCRLQWWQVVFWFCLAPQLQLPVHWWHSLALAIKIKLRSIESGDLYLEIELGLLDGTNLPRPRIPPRSRLCAIHSTPNRLLQVAPYPLLYTQTQTNDSQLRRGWSEA